MGGTLGLRVYAKFTTNKVDSRIGALLDELDMSHTNCVGARPLSTTREVIELLEVSPVEGT